MTFGVVIYQPVLKLNQIKVSLFIPNLHGGGAERVFINLTKILSGLGLSVELVVGNSEGDLNRQIEGINLIDLRSSSVVRAIIPLYRHLRKSKPDILMSAMPHANLAASIAVKFSFQKVKLICTVHENSFYSFQYISNYEKCILHAMKIGYSSVSGLVAVSAGLLRSQRDFYGKLLPQASTTIYNPIVPDEFITLPIRTSGNWSVESPFQVVSAGRLSFEKDFKTLISAFSLLPDIEKTRLIIYGEGAERPKLLALIEKLGIDKYVSLPGFTTNLNECLASSDVFVLSSKWEGFGNVIVEAIAAGCPVVSTNCESGPAEILVNGKYGQLVPVGDINKMALAIQAVREGNIEDFDTNEAIARFRFKSIGYSYQQFFDQCCSKES